MNLHDSMPIRAYFRIFLYLIVTHSVNTCMMHHHAGNQVAEFAMDVFEDADLSKGDAAFLRKHFVDLLRFRGLFVAEARMRSEGQGCYVLSLPFSRTKHPHVLIACKPV